MSKFEPIIALEDLREGGPVPPPRRVLPQRQILTKADQEQLYRRSSAYLRERRMCHSIGRDLSRFERK